MVVLVVVTGCGISDGGSDWTAECQERAANAYNIGHPYSKAEIAKACVDRADELEGLGTSDSDIREILDEFGSLDKSD